MFGISNLLTSNNIEFVKLALQAISDFISVKYTFTTFEHLAGTIQLFTKCNLWHNLEIAFNLFIQNQEANCISIVCDIIDQCLEFVGENVIEYMIHSMIKNNLFQNIMKVVCRKKSEWNFKIFWKIMNYASEQDACFMIICMDIIPYLCDKKMYFALIKKTKKLNKDKIWMIQDTPLDVQCLVYNVLQRIMQ
eukprot:72231_1